MDEIEKYIAKCMPKGIGSETLLELIEMLLKRIKNLEDRFPEDDGK